jgi:kynurenine formamidase
MITGPAVLALFVAAPPTGITLVALPMKIHGGSGGPLRAIAIVEER